MLLPSFSCCIGVAINAAAGVFCRRCVLHLHVCIYCWCIPFAMAGLLTCLSLMLLLILLLVSPYPPPKKKPPSGLLTWTTTV
jgi:hypothetical protein